MSASFDLPPVETLTAPSAMPRRNAVRGPIPVDLDTENIVAVIDNREQRPLNLSPMKVYWGTLATGDYSVRGLESVVAIERKSLDDFVACCGVERERFEACIQRLLAYPCRAIVIEATRGQLEAGGWRSRMTPASVLGSWFAWQARGIPIVMSGNPAQAGRDVVSLLSFAARRRWREARELVIGAQQTAMETG